MPHARMRIWCASHKNAGGTGECGNALVAYVEAVDRQRPIATPTGGEARALVTTRLKKRVQLTEQTPNKQP